MFKNFSVIVDTVQKSKLNNIVVNSNDLKTFKLTITINQFNKPIDLTGATVRIAIVKPDNKTVFQDCTITDPITGICEVVLDTQAFIIAGVYIAEVMIYFGADTVAVTGRFSYSVSKGILDNTTVESTNDWQSITQAIADAEEILIEAQSGLENVTEQFAKNVTYQQMPQRPTFTNGEIDGMEYLNPDGSVFRKESYEFGKDFVIERVTVNGETKSFKYDLNTLEMEVL